MEFQSARTSWDLTRRGLSMGVLNVTPDSFSDGGSFLDHDAAVRHGLEMLEQGAAIIDVGGESSRPGAEPVAADEEIRRVEPVIRRLREEIGNRPGQAISIDTQKPETAAAAVEAGADIINDITGMRDAEMRELAAQHQTGVVIMHMRGTPQTMQEDPHYNDVVREVRDFLQGQAELCCQAGLEPARVMIDPGIGFGKLHRHNLALLRAAPEFAALGYGLLYGVSRKSFIGKIIGSEEMDCRLWPTVGLTAWLYSRGVRAFRVHDVRENHHALLMAAHLEGAA